MLYFSFIFSYHEISKTRNIIKRLLLAVEDPYKGYLEFCQRILLAREKMMESRKPVLCSIPSIWMHETYLDGFEATAGSYLSLLNIRKSFPL